MTRTLTGLLLGEQYPGSLAYKRGLLTELQLTTRVTSSLECTMSVWLACN